MEDVIKRALDLYNRSRNKNIVTSTGFLTPAEAYEVGASINGVYFSGGGKDCERVVAFFLPDYMEPDYFSPEDYISALRLETKFGNLSHRDFLGAILGLGITRETVGDIMIVGDKAYIYCLSKVSDFVCLNLDKVGRYGAKTEKIDLNQVPQKESNREKIVFSVMSLRLDSVVSGMFGVSRTAGAKLVETGLVSVNYKECLKPDREIKSGDIISARGYGKGIVTDKGGTSRRGRTFVNAEIYK